MRICEIVQTCDIGAYSTRAVTRGYGNDNTKGIYFYNEDKTFTKILQEPSSFTGNDISGMLDPFGENGLTMPIKEENSTIIFLEEGGKID